jgi:hypothetical protein
LKPWDENLSHQGPLEWHHPPTKFHRNLPTGSKVDIGDRQIRAQTGWGSHKPISIFGKSEGGGFGGEKHKVEGEKAVLRITEQT